MRPPKSGRTNGRTNEETQDPNPAPPMRTQEEKMRRSGRAFRPPPHSNFHFDKENHFLRKYVSRKYFANFWKILFLQKTHPKKHTFPSSQSTICALFLFQTTKKQFCGIPPQDPHYAFLAPKAQNDQNSILLEQKRHSRHHRANPCKTNTFLGLQRPNFTISHFGRNFAFWAPKPFGALENEKVAPSSLKAVRGIPIFGPGKISKAFCD